MAAPTADQVAVELIANVGAYNSDIQRSAQQFDQSMRSMERSGQNAERAVVSSSAGMRDAVRGLARDLAVAFSIDKVREFSDAYTRFTNQLKVANLEGERLAATQNRLYGIAQRFGVPLEGLGTLYGRVAAAQKDLGASDAQLLQLTTTVSAALKIQGGDASASAGALLQLSQALGGSIVRAEEFNSIMEGARPLAQAAANGIAKYGGSVSKLRADVAAGNVTSKDFFAGILAGSGTTIAQAEKANFTLGASFTVLTNALTKQIGEFGTNTGAVATMSAAIRGLSENLDTIIPAVTVIAAAFGIHYVAGLASAEKGIVAATVAHARHLAGVVAGKRALNEAAEAELGVARAALFSAQDQAAASAEIVTATEARIAVLRQEQAAYQANIALAAEQRAAAAAAAREALAQNAANAQAGFRGVIVGAGGQSRTPDTGALAGGALQAEAAAQASRQALARVTEELAAAETTLAAASARQGAAMAAAQAATVRYTGAIAATGFAATAAAAATELFTTALSFVGGAPGAIILGLVVGLVALAGAAGDTAKAVKDAHQSTSDFEQRVEQTTGRSTEFKAAIDRLTSSQDATAGAARNAAGAFREQAAAADIAARAVASLTAQQRQKELGELDAAKIRLEGARRSVLGVDWTTGNITGGSPASDSQVGSRRADFFRSMGVGSTGGNLAPGILARAQANPAALTQQQQRALTAYTAALEARTSVERDLTAINVRRRALLETPYKPPAATTGKPAAAGAKPDPKAALVTAEQNARIASAGPDKRAAIEADYQVNLLKEKTRIMAAGNVKEADATAQATSYASRMRSAQLATLNAQEGKRGASSAKAAARRAEAAENRADSAESSTIAGIQQSRQAEAQAVERTRDAAVQRAEQALTDAAADATVTADVRRARVAQAAAELAIAQQASDALTNEIDRINAARDAKNQEIALNNRLNDAQRARLVAANVSAAAAQVQAARDAIAAREAQNRGAARAAIGANTQEALGAIAGSTGFPMAQRVAAERSLIDLQQAEQRARLETVLSQRGVDEATKELARRTLDTAQRQVPAAQAASQLAQMRQEGLQLEAGLARTSRERIAAERALLELTQRQREAATEVLIAQLDQSEASKALAARLRGALSTLNAGEREDMRRRQLSPLQRLRDPAVTGAGQKNRSGLPLGSRDDAEETVARGLSSLSENLSRADLSVEGFAAALGDTAKSVIQEILKRGIDQAIVAPLSKMAEEGLNKLFGTATQAAKGAAESQAAGDATRLAFAASAASSAMGSTTAAAISLAAALNAAAAASSSGGGGGGGPASIFSSLFNGMTGSSGGGGFGGGEGSIGIDSSIEGYGGGMASGGPVKPGFFYEINEQGRETFSPTVPGEITPAHKVGSARPGTAGGGVGAAGPTQVHLHNEGPPMQATAETTETGDTRIRLAPMFNDALGKAGQSGDLKRAMRKSPPDLKRA